jgi:hypothetical protein
MHPNRSRRRGLRLLPALVLAALTFGLAATAAQAKGPIPPVLPGLGGSGNGNDNNGNDSGNTADQSIGVVQLGPVTVDPGAVVADTPVANVVAGTTATVGEAGGNHASQSGGAAQVGGGNTTKRSVGVAQVSKSRTRSTVQAHTPSGHAVGVSVPTSIAGSGSNRADNSAVVVQVGGGHSDNGSTGAIRVNPTTAGVAVELGRPGRRHGAATVLSVSANEVLGKTLGVDLTSLGALPGPTTRLLLRIAHLAEPGVPASVGLRRLIDSGLLRIGERGDDIRIDLGSLTIQVVSLERHPRAILRLLGTTLALGGSAGVPDTGVPTSTDSLGVVQLGGGNTVTDSIGVAQISSLDVSPALGLRNDLLGTTAVLGGSSGVNGGNNQADNSIGVVQVGGVHVAPTFGLAIDGLGSLSLGGSIFGIPAGTNRATDSIGVVQIGGGNDARGAIGAVQSGAPTLAPIVTANVSPLGTGTSLSPVINLGGTGNGPGNSATGSVGAVQVGNGNTADQTIGTAQVGPTSVTGGPSGNGGGGNGGGGGTTGGGTTGGGTTGGGTTDGTPTAGTTPTSAGPTVSPTAASSGTTPGASGSHPSSAAPREQTANARSQTPASATVTPPAATQSGGGSSVLGSHLPFTGIALWVALLAALGLVSAGTALRKGAALRLH